MVTASSVSPLPVVRPARLLLPKEHGSWSLALEPVALGLLAAPSGSGAVFALAVVAGFLARRPLRMLITDQKPERRAAARRATAGCAVVAALAFAVTLVLAGTVWLPWLIPTVAAGALFLTFDLRQAGREQAAELWGAFAFSWLPAVFAALAGWHALAASALAVVMIARAIPTVLGVRATVRARKRQPVSVAVPLATAIVAVPVVGVLWERGLAPSTAAVAVGVLALRSLGYFVWPRPAWRASQIGMFEAALGIGFVTAVALTWF